MPWWGLAFIFVGPAAAAVWFWKEDDPVTAIAISATALSGWIGFKMGLGRIIASLGAFVAACYFAPSLGMNYETWFSEKFGTTGLTNRALCVASIGVLISLVVTALLSISFNAFLSRRKRLLGLNHLAGFGVGVVEGGAMLLLVLGAALSFENWQDRQADSQIGGKNKTAQWIAATASKTRESAIGEFVRENNPFETFETLADTLKIQRAVTRLRSGQDVERVLRNPKVTELQSDPDFREAVDALQRDKDLREFLREGKQVDREMLMQLLSHPAVLKLLDQDDFLARAKEALLEL